jgi:putative two-component system response regulator
MFHPSAVVADPETRADRFEMYRILAVDDDSAVRKLLGAGLNSLGYQVDLSANVPEAIRRLKTQRYSLVLSDYQMPNGTGLDLLAYVADVYPDLPFILLTGQNDVPLARSAIAAGALDFLPKPFELSELARLIEQNRVRWNRDREQVANLSAEILTGTLQALVAAVDAKDPHTACHSQRVSRLALVLGRAAGFTNEQLRVLGFAALLHDVGKIAIPESILLKPGPLTSEEWLTVRKHPARSASIVGQVDQLGEVATIVRHHHERMDGSGYPDGLVGSAIPLLSRLLAIVDIYEALTAKRSYRNAMSPDEARAVIRSGLGTHLDETLGKIFLSIPSLP